MKRGPEAVELPFVVYEATSACNLACRYCYNIWHAPGAVPPRPPSYGQSLRTLKALFKQAVVGHVSFSGGEPCLAERFFELVLYCRLRGADVTVITNGSGADRAGYKTLLDLGVGLFELPLHAPRPDVHDALTRVPGSWERSRASIRALVDLGASVVGVIVLTQINAHLTAETIGCLAALGVKRIMLARFNVGGRGIAERAALEPSRAQLQQAFAAAETVAAGGELRLSANVCLPLCVLNPTEYPHVPISSCSSEIRRRPLTLTPQGGLRFCNHSPIEAGNILRQPVAEVLASPYLARWATQVPRYCAACHLWRHCHGGCRAAAEQLGGTLADVDPIVLSGGRAPPARDPVAR